MARDTRDDPRYRRVRQRLVHALFDLAGSRAAEDIAVSELAAAAGVSRASFYTHATTPAGLLADALIDELRPGLVGLAAEFDHAAEHAAVWRRIYLLLLQHVAGHRDVYRVIALHESSVSAALTSFFEELTAGFVDLVMVQLDDLPFRPLWRAMAIGQQAHSMLAVIQAWVRTGFEEAPEVVVETYLTLAPPWQLARADEQGHITLRRTRVLSRAGQEAVN